MLVLERSVLSNHKNHHETVNLFPYNPRLLEPWISPEPRHSTLEFPQNDGHTEKLEIKKEGLGGVQWGKREDGGVLTENSRKK